MTAWLEIARSQLSRIGAARAGDRGATAVEYALIGCFIALAVLIGVGISGNGLNRIFAITGDRVMNAANVAEQAPN